MLPFARVGSDTLVVLNGMARVSVTVRFSTVGDGGTASVGEGYAKVAKLLAAGATTLRADDIPEEDHYAFVLADPEGNEFCVV